MTFKILIGPGVYQEDPYQEHWSKCPYCGAKNGSFGSVLEEHRPRCRFSGEASSFTLTIPSYNKRIDEDDVQLVPLLRARNSLYNAQRRVKELERELKRRGCDDAKEQED